MDTQQREHPPEPRFSVSLVFLCIVGVVLFLAWNANRNKERQAEGRANATDTTASELHRAYAVNEVAGDQAYKEKWLRIKGTISRVRTDLGGDPIVCLDTGERFAEIDCHFPTSAASRVAILKPGQSVTIVGRCRGKTLGIYLQDCELPY